MTNMWHRVKRKDQQRIRCTHCGEPAKVCEYAEWNTGNTTGISFWYMCLEHGKEHGFPPGKVEAGK